LFVNFKAAYETIRRNKLLEALKEFKIPQKIIRLVKLILKHVRYRVKIQSNLSVQSEISVRIRHGNAVSTLVFKLALGKVIMD